MLGMERGVFFGGLLISVSFLAAVLFNQSAVEEAPAPAAVESVQSVTAPIARPSGSPTSVADGCCSKALCEHVDPSAVPCGPCPNPAAAQAPVAASDRARCK